MIFLRQFPWYLGDSLEYPEEVTVVTAMDQEYQYFGGEDKRTVEVDVDFPETGDWAQVGLYFRLNALKMGSATTGIAPAAFTSCSTQTQMSTMSLLYGTSLPTALE